MSPERKLTEVDHLCRALTANSTADLGTVLISTQIRDMITTTLREQQQNYRNALDDNAALVRAGVVQSTDKREAIVKLLESAMCPTKDCDQNGSLRNNRFDELPEQCQWCFERWSAIQFLAAQGNAATTGDEQKDAAVAPQMNSEHREKRASIGRVTESDESRHRIPRANPDLTPTGAHEGLIARIEELRDRLRDPEQAVSRSDIHWLTHDAANLLQECRAALQGKNDGA